MKEKKGTRRESPARGKYYQNRPGVSKPLRNEAGFCKNEAVAKGKKGKKDKRLGDRRQTDRRGRRRRLAKKASGTGNRRAPKDRRRVDRRQGVRRQGDTYLAKVQEFEAEKSTVPRPPVDEDEPVNLLESADDSEKLSSEDEETSTDRDPEEENN